MLSLNSLPLRVRCDVATGESCGQAWLWTSEYCIYFPIGNHERLLDPTDNSTRKRKHGPTDASGGCTTENLGQVFG